MILGKNSYGITLPKTWIRFLEDKHGKIDFVSMEVNEALIIRPNLPKKSKINRIME